MNPLALLSGPYGLLIKVGLIVALLIGIYVYGHHKGYTEEKALFDVFVAKTEALGEAAKADKQRIELENKKKKEEADAKQVKTFNDLNATIKRLRDARPSSSIVPIAPATSSRPDLACYDRPEFVGAVGGLVDQVRGLVDQGSAATLDLNNAKEWAKP